MLCMMYGVTVTTETTMNLMPQHAELLRASAISPEVVAARGYRTVTRKADLEELGFGVKQRRVPALLIPIHDVRGEIGLYQIRPDVPRRNKSGKALKYETPTGARMALDVPPGALRCSRPAGVSARPLASCQRTWEGRRGS